MDDLSLLPSANCIPIADTPSGVPASGTPPVWHQEEGMVEIFSLHPDIERYFKVALAKRCMSHTCCCFSNPVTAVFGSILPCLVGPVNECCCAHPTFLNRNTKRNVCLTERGITIKTIKAKNKTKKRYRYQDSPTARMHKPSWGIHALDQFSIDREWETSDDGATARYDTRRLYYDQIRSASIIPNGGYHTNCMCFCCCGFQHEQSNIKFIRIDIGRDNVAEDTGDLNMRNPILVGLKEAERFCFEVNKRARGGKRALHGETKVVDIVIHDQLGQSQAVPTAPLMSRLVVPEPPSIAEETTSSTDTMLSTELENLANLHRTGALTDDEFQSSKDACIKRYS
jgi:hypothetical protein